MRRAIRRPAIAFAALLAFALVSWAAFRGYLTADMMVYLVTLKWCL